MKAVIAIPAAAGKPAGKYVDLMFLRQYHNSTALPLDELLHVVIKEMPIKDYEEGELFVYLDEYFKNKNQTGQ